MINKQILRSIASITKRVGDLASPNIDKISSNKSITLSGEVIVADGTMDSYSGDVVIEGRTMQNVMPDVNDRNYIRDAKNVRIVNEKEYIINAVPPGVHVFIGPKIESISLLYNSLYTLYTNYSRIDSDAFDYVKFANTHRSMAIETKEKMDKSMDYLVTTTTTQSTKPDNAVMGFRCLGVSQTPGVAGSVTFKDMMCLLGDHTAKEPIKYFKNVHSLGENGKIYMKSSNRNVFPTSHNFKEGDLTPVFPNETKVEYNNGVAIITKLSSSDARHVLFKHRVYLKKGIKYYVVAEMETSDKSTNCIAIRNSIGDFEYKSEDNMDRIKRLEFISEKTGYFNIAFTTTNLQLNSTLTVKFCYFGTRPMGDEILQHQENIIEIPLQEPLRSIDTIGVADKIIRKGNKYFIERNVGRMDVDESTSSNWITHTLGTESKTLSFKTTMLCDLSMQGLDTSRIYCVSSLLKGSPHNVIYQEKTNTDIGVSISESGRTYLRILKDSILPSDTLEGFREYVKNNPFFVLYPLKEPVYEELEIEDLQIEIYPEVSIISVYDDCMHGNTTIEIPMNLLSIISNDVRKIGSLEKEIENAERTVLTETMNILNIDEQFNNHIHQI